MSPLPLARSETAVQPALFLPANLLEDVHHRDSGQTTTVTVTVTKWYPTPQPTSSITGYMPGMSRDAIAPLTTQPPAIHCPTSETLACATSFSTSVGSSGTSLRSGLIAGTVAGVLILTAQAAVCYILWRRRRRRACTPIRIGNYECRSERPSIEPASSRSARESRLQVTPYDVAEAPPRYDALDRKANVAPPEPVLVRLGTIRQNTYSQREESCPPSTISTCSPSTGAPPSTRFTGGWDNLDPRDRITAAGALSKV